MSESMVQLQTESQVQSKELGGQSGQWTIESTELCPFCDIGLLQRGVTQNSWQWWQTGWTHPVDRTKELSTHIFRERNKMAGTLANKRYWDGSAQDKVCACRVVIRVVDTRGLVTVCKIALQLNTCFAMQAEVTGCDSLFLTFDVFWKDGTMDYDILKRCWTGTCKTCYRQAGTAQHELWHVTPLGVQMDMHGLLTFQSALKWAGLVLKHIAIHVVVSSLLLICILEEEVREGTAAWMEKISGYGDNGKDISKHDLRKQEKNQCLGGHVGRQVHTRSLESRSRDRLVEKENLGGNMSSHAGGGYLHEKEWRCGSAVRHGEMASGNHWDCERDLRRNTATLSGDSLLRCVAAAFDFCMLMLVMFWSATQ